MEERKKRIAAPAKAQTVGMPVERHRFDRGGQRVSNKQINSIASKMITYFVDEM